MKKNDEDVPPLEENYHEDAVPISPTQLLSDSLTNISFNAVSQPMKVEKTQRKPGHRQPKKGPAIKINTAYG